MYNFFLAVTACKKPSGTRTVPILHHSHLRNVQEPRSSVLWCCNVVQKALS